MRPLLCATLGTLVLGTSLVAPSATSRPQQDSAYASRAMYSPISSITEIPPSDELFDVPPLDSPLFPGVPLGPDGYEAPRFVKLLYVLPPALPLEPYRI